MTSSEEVIRDALRLTGISKDKDVEELSLSKRKLLEVMDLSRFKYLKHLWLNGNKIRQVHFLHSNFRLCELHLHDNHLSDISGSLRHLTCLVVLTLQNNYLTDLVKTAKEFDRMHALSVLSLFDNPLALEPEYRSFVINSIPSLTFLDGSGVTECDREKAGRICLRNQDTVKDTVAFGRRSLGPPRVYFPVSPKRYVTRPETPANNYLKNNPPFESLEEAAKARQMTKSLNMYSMLDWSTVPKSEDRRCSGVTECDREKAGRICLRNQDTVKDTVAFGRRSLGPPRVYFPVSPKRYVTRPETPANNYLKNNPPFESLEEAAKARQMTKSLNMYSMLDWSTVPKSEDRRCSGGQFELPCFITHVFR